MQILVMGVSGSGKSVLGRALSEAQGWVLLEGDDFHPPANIAKMRAGVPLSDDDRWPWLAAIAQAMATQHHAGHSVVVCCSALKRAYRDVLRGAGPLFIVWLKGDAPMLRQRLLSRPGHFMPASLIDSQLATLEPPGADEGALVLDAGAPLDRNVAAVLAAAHAQGKA